MKDLKDIILDRRIRNLEIQGKQVPDKYISVFNSYLEQIAESLTDYTKQVRKEVCEEIKQKALENTCYKTKEEVKNYIYTLNVDEILEILDQIQGE